MESSSRQNFASFFKRFNPDLKNYSSTMGSVLLPIDIDRLRTTASSRRDQRQETFVVFRRIRAIGTIHNCETLLNHGHGTPLTEAKVVAFSTFSTSVPFDDDG